MSAPPPPPPPPPSAPSLPSFGGGGGGGPPAFLADIRKGSQLKKVPDSLKNDRSAALVSGGAVTSASGGGSSSAVGGGGRPMGGGGAAVPSNADIKAKLNAMFGGAAVPSPAPRTEYQSPVKQPSITSQPQAPKASYAHPNPPPPPPPRTSQTEWSSPSVIPVLPDQPQAPKPRREAPRGPGSTSVNGALRSFRAKPQAPPPPPQNSPGAGGTYKPVSQFTRNDRVAPSLPARDTYSWESRFKFPDESYFPPVPDTYRGPKTFVLYRANGDDL
nr:Actin binding WH2 [Hymenolepis microstoma]